MLDLMPSCSLTMSHRSGRDLAASCCSTCSARPVFLQEFNRGLFDYLIATDDPSKAPAQQQQTGTKRKADVLEAASDAGLDDEPDISTPAEVRRAAACSTSAQAGSCTETQRTQH